MSSSDSCLSMCSPLLVLCFAFVNNVTFIIVIMIYTTVFCYHYVLTCRWRQSVPRELDDKLALLILCFVLTIRHTRQQMHIQGESLARGSKLSSIKNYVIEVMTWKFIYTYREWCKTGPAHNQCWNWFPFTSKHTWMRFSKFWNNFPNVSTLTAWISWRIAGLHTVLKF